MKNKDWNINFTRPAAARALTQAGFSPLLSQVLALRGIENAAQAKKLLYGGKETLHDPLLMLGMDGARARVMQAIGQHETVAVFGDYDVDGITSTCILTDWLRSKGLTCYYYIPDRNEEGYGLNCGALDTLKAKGVTLVITVDCGITAVEEADYARSIGVDMIITDHHECRSDALPDAAAMCERRSIPLSFLYLRPRSMTVFWRSRSTV